MVTAFVALAVLSLFVGGGAASDAENLIFYGCILAASGAVAFGVSRRHGLSTRAAWAASALSVGAMIALLMAVYITYFEFALDGGFEDLD